MEKIINLFLLGLVLGAVTQTTLNLKTLNNAMRAQNAIAKTK